MVSVKEAKNILQEHLQVLPKLGYSVYDQGSLFLGEDIISPMDVPSFDNSAMDGYALHVQEALSSYPVVDLVVAGKEPKLSLIPGQACRIFTGAPVPLGTTAVCPQELVQYKDGFIALDPSSVKPGQHIRLKGSQCREGTIIAKSGSAIQPGVIGLLCSCGISSYLSPRRVRVACVITGNEPVEPGSPLPPAGIYNSNGPALQRYLAQLPVEMMGIYRAKDDLEDLKKTLENAAERADVVIITGGISVGEFDLVSPVLRQMGVQELFHKIRQKPGKPMYAGMREQQWFFGLPGNPVSVLACFNQYVKPFLYGLMGEPHPFEAKARWPLKNGLKKKTGMSHILKGHLSEGHIAILEGQESFNLMHFDQCNGFALVDESIEELEMGALVEWFPW